MGAERSQWMFPRNERGKLIGWRDEGSGTSSLGLENKDPADIIGSIGEDALAALVGLPSPAEADTFLRRDAGNTVYEALTGEDVRTSIKAAPFVETLAELKAMDPAKTRVVFLKAGIKWKRYVWALGNYGSFITADSNGYAWVKADNTLASVGAYVFSPQVEMVHAMHDFGFQTGQSVSTDGLLSYDNTPNMNVLFLFLNSQSGDLQLGATRAHGCYWPQGAYWFKSKPDDPVTSFHFKGDGSSLTTFVRDYVEASPSFGLINIRPTLTSNHVIEGLTILASKNSSGGRGYSNVASSTAHSNYFQLIDFETTAITPGDWGDYGTAVIGDAKNVSPLGIRAPRLTRCKFFGGPSGAILMSGVIDPIIQGSGTFNAGGGTGALVVSGDSTVDTFYANYNFGNLDALTIGHSDSAVITAGNIAQDVSFGAGAANAKVKTSKVGGNVSFASGATDCELRGNIVGNLTFTSGAVDCVVIGQVTGTISGAGVNGCQVIDPTKNDWVTLFDGAVSGANYELGSLSGFRKIELNGTLIPATDGADLYLRIGSGTVDSGGSDYLYQLARASAAAASGAAATTSFILLSPFGVGNASGECIRFKVEIDNFNKALYSSVGGEAGNIMTTGAAASGVVFGQRLEAAAHDIVRLLFSSGDIASGSVLTVRGWRG